MRFLFLTMDGNHDTALREATRTLQTAHQVELQLGLYNATRLRDDADWHQLAEDVGRADFVFGSMLFGEELVRPLQRILGASSHPVCVITSNPALIRCTHMGKFVLQQRSKDEAPGLLKQWINKFRPKGGHGEGKRQLAMLRNLGKIMKHIPGKAQDLHSYIAVHDYWLHCSPENLRRMLCLLIDRYVPGQAHRLPIEDPIHYPDAAIYHPDAPRPFPDLASYQSWRQAREKGQVVQKNGNGASHPVTQSPNPLITQSSGSVGLLSLRTVILSGNTAHLDALIRALEARGIEARAAYSAGLDFRPAIDQFFTANGNGADEGEDADTPFISHYSSVDLLLNGAGFSLVGGMAESRPEEARESLEALDVAYLDMIPLAFQRVEDWQRDDVGLTPMQMAMNIAIPELDGAAEPLVYGGPTAGSDKFVALDAQVDLAADRIARHVTLHRRSNAEKKVAVVLFNFPPNLGNVGTAAYLDVFASLYRLLGELQADGYCVDLPPDVETLRQQVVEGNSFTYGTDGNVGARLPLEDYRRLFPAYAQIEKFWGYAPGELLNDGKHFHILGKQFGNIFVGIQPSFGYERDPMRLLMAKDAAPHHGFAAFYTWIEQVFGADAVVHFGTHGALEFMPGKQAGMSAICWPTRLLGTLPNFYYYSVNNPSEATIAKRRSAATLISYLVPPLQQAGLYKGLRLLKDSIDSYRQRPAAQLLEDIRTQADKLGITVESTKLETECPTEEAYVAALAHELIQVEHRMIPLGLHVLGEPPDDAQLVDTLALVAAFTRPKHPTRNETLPPLLEQIAQGCGWEYETLRKTLKTDSTAQARWDQLDAISREAMRRFVEAFHHAPFDPTPVDVYLQEAANLPPGQLADLWRFLADLLDRMGREQEVDGLLRALGGGFISPSPGNDVVRNVDIVPTGRNIHALDPFRVPTPAAHVAGAQLMVELLERLTREQGVLPETVAMVLWGTDNLKSDCEGVAQVLALLGARAIQDELGKVSDVELISLKELGRPRIDVVVTVSGIFRDLLHHQMNLLDKAVRLAAEVPEPLEFNFVRKHALAQSAELGISLHEAATRVFTNAPGNYGANVNHLVESGTWENEAELSEAFLGRKSFTYGGNGQWRDARVIMERALATVDAAFQNIDSFEIGISDIDHYYEYLGGVTKSVERIGGQRPAVVVADAFSLGGRLASLEQMVRLESRAKLLNPKWYEAMLVHGYEGVREIETRVSNTYGWSATTGAVEGWVYQNVADTFLLDEGMRERLAQANPHATAAIARRLLEADARGFWDAAEETITQLRSIYGRLEDRLEGVTG
jgi:magnesium chelatase subunit H